MRKASTIAVTALATLMTPSLSACFVADPGTSGIEVRDDTTKTIWIDKFPEIEDSVRLKVEVGEQTFVATEECTQRRLEVQTRIWSRDRGP